MNIKDFIRDNELLIDNLKFDEVYKKLIGNPNETPMLTRLFYEIGINPLTVLNYVPEYYLVATESFNINLIIPNHVEEIRTMAFMGSGIKSCVFDMNYSKLHEVNYRAFGDTNNLRQVIFPNSLQVLGYAVFENCKNLEMVSIPNKVKMLAEIFYNCDKLKQLTYRGTMNEWKNIYRTFDERVFNGSVIESIKCLDGEIRI